MKQTRVTAINNGPANSSAPSPGAAVENPMQNSDLGWVDEVAALLPEDLRLGWYRNVKPWISTLPPEDEVARLAYSMGYLALLVRSTPALVAAERARLVPVFQQVSKEAADSLNTTALYHRKLEERLTRLPAEIAEGLSTAAFASTITDAVRYQFSKSGIPEAGRLLSEQGERMQKLASEQAEALCRLRFSINDSNKKATDSLEAVQTASCQVGDSIKRWNREMLRVQWAEHGLILLMGLLLGCLLYWWISSPPSQKAIQQAAPVQTSSPQPSNGPTNLHPHGTLHLR